MLLIALLLAALPQLAAQPDRFGIPACSSPDQELAVRSSFLLCHSASLRVATWAADELTREKLIAVVPRPRHFRHDATLAGAGAYDGDYQLCGAQHNP